MQRIFVAINLPENIKDELVNYQNKFDWEGLSWVKWTKRENLHITLEFVGNISDAELQSVFKKTEEFAEKTPVFKIRLDKINYFPDNRLPKYVFATGGKYHVTVARIKEWQWRKINPDERPDVREDINLNFEAKSVEVMESKLSRSGPEYKILKSYPLM